ncbi:hypothetical protein MuYL_1954 [Mucilaginibacter xinganensis]|uniref:Uncharacterized protein n=1 Tax=Mucilaginibacter xinganensis TaxID=1234841 RepID=A0A223NVQ3_9SPHI|nr:hypothetical protein MuYL_1954 [Mucilaginibacter xinganensis]
MAYCLALMGSSYYLTTFYNWWLANRIYLICIYDPKLSK